MGDVFQSALLGNVLTSLPDDQCQFYLMLNIGDPFRDHDRFTIMYDARWRFNEDDRFLWKDCIRFDDMWTIVPTHTYDLTGQIHEKLPLTVNSFFLSSGFGTTRGTFFSARNPLQII